jgi:hypothetical protein
MKNKLFLTAVIIFTVSFFNASLASANLNKNLIIAKGGGEIILASNPTNTTKSVSLDVKNISGILELATTEKTRGLNSYYLDTGSSQKTLIQTTRNFSSYLNKNVSIEIEGSLDDFILKDVYLTSTGKSITTTKSTPVVLPQTGSSTWLLFSLALGVTALHLRRRFN